MFCFFFYSCLCVGVLVCVLMFCGRNVTALSVLSCLANCGSCYLGHLQHGLPLFYAFHFHVQFRIWRTLSLKDCTWNLIGAAVVSPVFSLQTPQSHQSPPLPFSVRLRPSTSDCVAALWWPILWWLRCALSVPTALGPVASPHSLFVCVWVCVVCALFWLTQLKWNVKCNPVACHVPCLFACQPCSQKGPTLKAESSSQ